MMIKAILFALILLGVTQFGTRWKTESSISEARIPLGASIAWSKNEHGTHIVTLVPSSEDAKADCKGTCETNADGLQTLASFLTQPSVWQDIMTKYKKTGLVLLRGFPFANWKEAESIFEQMTEHHSGGGPFGFLPGWMLNSAYDLVMTAMLRFADAKRTDGLRALGPVSQNVQGPHQEGQLFQWRWPHVSFYAEVAPKEYGETAVYDAAAAFRALPSALQTKVKEYEFYYHLQMDVLYERLPAWMYNIVSRVALWMMNNKTTWVPLVLQSPASEEPCLQFFGFGKDINQRVTDAFNKRYPGRDTIACNDYYGEYFIRKAPKTNTTTKVAPMVGKPAIQERFTQEEEMAIMEAFMASSQLLKWETNDFILVDNIRWAHGRVNGDDSPRVIHHFRSQPTIDVFPLAVRD